MRVLTFFFALLLWSADGVRATDLRVAVAANFRAPMAEIAELFTLATGHPVSISTGSSGQLFAQIANGAPFDLFLSADQARPERLVALGLAAPESRFTYAEGQLYLLLRAAGSADEAPDLAQVQRVSIANPSTAPYGAAAMQVLEQLDFPEGAPQIAQAQSIAGVNAAFASGAVDAGFAAFASVATLPQRPPGWLVPRGLHDPIRQDAVLLSRASDNPAAIALLDWLGTDTARLLIERYGYHVP